ncbi:hypothetical protein [Streptomyces sp. NBC_00145]|uniref:hypothetical protein n=1 Tax=Streptomyces sp. NBC_00145 TaxID=2975666 RepID=UPI002E194F17
MPASQTWKRHSTSYAAAPSAAPTWPGPPPAPRKYSSASPTSPTPSRPGTAPHPDLTAARRAVTRGLDIDDTAEILYQDWMLIEDQAGNRTGVSAAYETLRGINQRLQIGIDGETEKVFDTIMSRPAS